MSKPTTAKKVFIIQQVTWEYNDENYYQPEAGSGTPAKAFRTRAAAERELLRLTIAEFKNTFKAGQYSTRLGEFAYDSLDNITSLEPEAFREVLENIGLLPDDEDPMNVTIPDDYPDDQVRILVEACDKLVFYTIEEMELN